MNPEFVPQLEKAGLSFVGHDVEGERMEIMELTGKAPNSVSLILLI